MSNQLLILAAGGAALYFLSQKKETAAATPKSRPTSKVSAPGGGLMPHVTNVSVGGTGGSAQKFGVSGGASLLDVNAKKLFDALFGKSKKPEDTKTNVEPGALGKIYGPPEESPVYGPPEPPVYGPPEASPVYGPPEESPVYGPPEEPIYDTSPPSEGFDSIGYDFGGGLA